MSKITTTFLFLMFVLLGSASAQQLNPGGGGGGGTLGGPITVMSINKTYLYADQFPGATIDAKIASAETACPNTGCTIDASNITGPQIWNTTLNLTKPTKLLLNGQISYTGAPLPNGLIHLAETGGSGDDISCAYGTGVTSVNPPLPSWPGGPVPLNPANLLQLWQCYILTKPAGPLAQVNITSISMTPASPPIATVTAASTVPFIPGQGVRISGEISDTNHPSAELFNDFTIVQSVSGNTFTFVGHPPQAFDIPPNLPTTPGYPAGSTGLATAYMPVIDITYSTSNVNVHDINFVANANTGSVIHESAGNRLGLAIINNHYNHNQMINTDGIGASGYGVEITSTIGLGENLNTKEIAWNQIAGLAGCYFVDQSQIVQTSILGNACSFATYTPAIKLDCYQCGNTQNTDYKLNVTWATAGPANRPVMEINSGYSINIENNDFELPNIMQNANVDWIWIHQGAGYIKNNSFLSTPPPNPNPNSGRYAINVDSTSAYGHLIVDGNHSSGGETTFFNDPVNQVSPAGGGFQGYLYYGHNEDYNRQPGPGTQLEPTLNQLTGTGNGAPYTTTSTSFVPIDAGRMIQDFWMPASYVVNISGQAAIYNSTAGQDGCLAIIDQVSGAVLAETVQGASNANYTSASVQYTIPYQFQGNHYRIALAFASCSGSGTTFVANQNTPLRPYMSVALVPAFGASN